MIDLRPRLIHPYTLIKRSIKKLMTFFKSLGKYRAFSITWPASMLIHWNKRSFYIRKEFNSDRVVLVHQHGRRFIALEHQYGGGDVIWKRSLHRCPSSLSYMCLHWSGWLGLGLGLGMSSYIHLSVNAGVQSYFWFSQFSHRLNVKKLAPAHVFRSWLLLLILTRTLNFR